MKTIIRLLLVFIFTQASLLNVASQENVKVPWLKGNVSYVGNSETNRIFYTLVDKTACHFDNLDNLICFEVAWRDACLEVFTMFSISDDIPYVFSKKGLPVLEVDGFNKIDLSYLVEIEEITGPVLPWSYHEELILWRVEVGSLDTLLESEEGIIFHLLNGDDMSIFFPLQNGTIMRSRVTLHGLKPLLQSILEEARASKPVGQECAG